MRKYIQKLFNKTHNLENDDSPITDSYADLLSLDLKRAAIDAILSALNQNQEKYLSSILKKSYFPIESIVFHPLDNETALQTEEFFRIHNEIDGNFEKTFFEGLILKEYRTQFGAHACPSENLIPSIQPSIASMDDPTNDESYQISLRGNKKRFSAEVKLGVLKPKNFGTHSQNDNHDFLKKHLDTSAPSISVEKEIFRPSTHIPNESNEIPICIHIKDADGEHTHTIRTPFIIGREASQLETQFEKVNVQGMYISRHQLTVFQIDGVAYCFIPKQASLTGISGRRGILQKMHLLEIDTSGIAITFGQPLASMQISLDMSDSSLYPVIQLKKASYYSEVHNSTPIPKIKK